MVPNLDPDALIPILDEMRGVFSSSSFSFRVKSLDFDGFDSNDSGSASSRRDRLCFNLEATGLQIGLFHNLCRVTLRRKYPLILLNWIPLLIWSMRSGDCIECTEFHWLSSRVSTSGDSYYDKRRCNSIGLRLVHRRRVILRRKLDIYSFCIEKRQWVLIG